MAASSNGAVSSTATRSVAGAGAAIRSAASAHQARRLGFSIRSANLRGTPLRRHVDARRMTVMESMPWPIRSSSSSIAAGSMPMAFATACRIASKVDGSPVTITPQKTWSRHPVGYKSAGIVSIGAPGR